MVAWIIWSIGLGMRKFASPQVVVVTSFHPIAHEHSLKSQLSFLSSSSPPLALLKSQFFFLCSPTSERRTSRYSCHFQPFLHDRNESCLVLLPRHSLSFVAQIHGDWQGRRKLILSSADVGATCVRWTNAVHPKTRASFVQVEVDNKTEGMLKLKIASPW